jgi:hypothetical protein
MSDGANNKGRTLGQADAVAKAAGVPVSTIAFEAATSRTLVLPSVCWCRVSAMSQTAAVAANAPAAASTARLGRNQTAVATRRGGIDYQCGAR